MNKDRHDVLYSRARCALNYNVKRLWFRINPFLERKETLKDRPEQPSKFIQPLQSTVLGENFWNVGDAETDRDSQEIETGNFWDFLYSDAWEKACSIRILEGQLLDHLITQLDVFLKKQSIVQHKTFAYARNTRERRGCYKLANQKGCGEIRETLLLEFTYYGRRCSPIETENSTFSSYPESTTSGFTPQWSYGQESDGRPYPMSRNGSVDRGSGMKTPTPPRTPKGKTKALPQIVRRKSKGTQSKMEQNRRYRLQEEKEKNQQMEMSIFKKPEDYTFCQAIEIIPKDTSNASSDSDYRTIAKKIDLDKLKCSERIEYMDGLDSIVEEYEMTEESMGFGEELYLSDIGDICNPCDNKSVVQVLARNKIELAKKREERKRQEELLNQFKPCRLPQMPNLDIEKMKVQNTGRAAFKFKFLLTEVPSFERLVTILDSEDKCDPRYRRSKQMSKKIANRYNLTKEALHKRNLETAELNTNVKKRFEILKRFQIFASASKKNVRSDEKTDVSDLVSTFSRGIKKNRSKTSLSRTQIANKRDDEISEKKYTAEMAAEVGGVTDSKKCEKHILDQVSKKKLMNISERRKSRAMKKISYKQRDILPDIILTTPSGTNSDLTEKADPLSGARYENIRQSPKRFMGSKIPKCKKKSSAEVKAGKEAKSSTFSEKESDFSSGEDETPELFNAKKLNLRYSFEKLKGKNYHKKKPAFYEILKKYYRAQKTIDLLSKPSPTKGKRRSIFERLLEKTTIKPEPKMTIGTLKRYPFQQYTRKPTAAIEMANFANVSMVEFSKKLLKSLDDFVVRKELVVSNRLGKSSTSISFTRKSVFLKK